MRIDQQTGRLNYIQSKEDLESFWAEIENSRTRRKSRRVPA